MQPFSFWLSVGPRPVKAKLLYWTIFPQTWSPSALSASAIRHPPPVLLACGVDITLPGSSLSSPPSSLSFWSLSTRPTFPSKGCRATRSRVDPSRHRATKDLDRRRKIPANARNESLTASAVGKTLATSGASRTTLEPFAYRLAYLPLTPLLKSYSARMSFARLVCFFILLSFTFTGRSSTDQAQTIASLGGDNNKDFARFRNANGHKALLRQGMQRIRNGNGAPVPEHRRSLLKRDRVFRQVQARFRSVPLKSQTHFLSPEAPIPRPPPSSSNSPVSPRLRESQSFRSSPLDCSTLRRPSHTRCWNCLGRGIFPHE